MGVAPIKKRSNRNSMPKKRKKKSNKSKERFTSISHHKHQGGMLKSKISGLNLEMIDWDRDLMIEHLWIELLVNEYSQHNWYKIYEDFMDKLDASLESERKTPLLGYLSDFGTLSESEKSSFLSKKNKDFIYEFFFKPIGKILSLYPENPANWLILEEWKKKEKIDFETELKKLAGSLSRLIKAKDEYAGHIRVIPSTRLFKHGKIHLPSTGMEDFVDCLVRYPRQCTEEEKFKVQQIVRCHMNTFLMIEERYKEKSWPKYFWRQNYNLVTCHPVSKSLQKGGLLDVAVMKTLQEKLWKNCVLLMKYLDKIAMQYKYDLYDPTVDEIKLGLFSRIVRLFIGFTSNPSLWNRDFSGIMLRCLGETTIIFFYLITQGTDQEFLAFKNYALGKEKLLMLHLQDNLSEETSLEGKSIDDIAQEIGGSFNAEITDIDLKDWTKKSIWQMAHEVRLENIYRWVIDPSSSEIHGSWSSIRKSNLVVCSQILHRFHMVPKYYEPPIYLLSLFVAQQIYLRSQQLGIEKLNFPEPDTPLKDIPEIGEAWGKRI